MRLILTILACLFTLPALSQGLYTELGLGVRLTNASSYLENPACKSVYVVEPGWPNNPRGLSGGDPTLSPHNYYSCGGDEPIFVGDIIGWEFKNGVSISLCHKSQWFDGNGELHWTGICSSKRIYWKNIRKRK